jgi:hypothetical protein
VEHMFFRAGSSEDEEPAMENGQKRQRREDADEHRESGDEEGGGGDQNADSGFQDLLKDAGLTFMPGNPAHTTSRLLMCFFVGKLCTQRSQLIEKVEANPRKRICSCSYVLLLHNAPSQGIHISHGRKSNPDNVDQPPDGRCSASNTAILSQSIKRKLMISRQSRQDFLEGLEEYLVRSNSMPQTIRHTWILTCSKAPLAILYTPS